MKNLINTKIIEDYLNSQGLSKTAFCKKCKISISTYNKIFAGKNCKLTVLIKITREINIKLHQILNN